ncbi:6-phosphogluconolactonase [Paraferrimonas sp. SM1919]|uniref:6-phosphogluconolactonase n=1 Tax=Paraferrimonas sp. SM1919 TaxID=2662263 RepID=UPI0013D20028|nr:6-phosphogluconolactonase [Paraferrimonas sp. SM1919]
MIDVSVFKEFNQPSELEAALSQKIASQLQAAVDTNGSASLLVSGGNTPKALFQALSNIAIDWQDVFVTLVDERWVPNTDAASNEKTVRENLLQNKAATAKFRPLVNMFETPEQGLQMVTESLSNLPQPFDVVVLGMGNDGHTASWFPCCEQVDECFDTDALLLATHPTTAPNARITFSASAILKAKQIYLHIVGQEKLDVYNQAISDKDIKTMPIRAVLNQKAAPVDVYWSA